MLSILVQKFGGASLSERGQILRAVEVVRRAQADGRSPVVCVSARGHTTDALLTEAAEFGAGSAREVDQLLSTGEIASAAIMAMALNGRGVPAISLTGGQAGISVTETSGDVRVFGISTERIWGHLRKGTVVVVAGFQGVDGAGDVRTLGREGSDTTAVALAAELGAGNCEIYTNVDGVYTADPRVVPDARVLPVVPAPVMSEMAVSGARVLHSRAVELSAVRGITVTVRNPATGAPGTVIPGRSEDMLETTGFIAAVTHDPYVARVLVYHDGPGHDLARVIIGLLSEKLVPVDLIGWSGGADRGASLGFTVRTERLGEVEHVLRGTAAKFGFGYSVNTRVGQVSLVGVGLLNRPDHTARMLRVLDRLGITVDGMSIAQSRTTVLVPLERTGEVAAAVHEEFGLGRSDAVIQTMAST